jgi:hypothetical protein
VIGIDSNRYCPYEGRPGYTEPVSLNTAFSILANFIWMALNCEGHEKAAPIEYFCAVISIKHNASI